MIDVFANVTVGKRRWGRFWWKTFNWKEGNVLRITRELAENMGWKGGDEKFVFGPYRLKILRVDSHTNILYGQQMSGSVEQAIRRYSIFLGDLVASLLGCGY